MVKNHGKIAFYQNRALILTLFSFLCCASGCCAIITDSVDMVKTAFDKPTIAEPTVFDPLVIVVNETFVLRPGVTKEHIIALALQYPEDALYSPAFYMVATPEQVAAALGGKPLPPVRLIHSEVIDRPSRFVISGPSGLPAFGVRPKQEPVYSKRYAKPLSIAAVSTPHPEVLEILLEAYSGEKPLLPTQITEPRSGKIVYGNPNFDLYRFSVEHATKEQRTSLLPDCIRRNDFRKLEWLISLGVNINARLDSNDKMNLLTFAIFEGKRDMALELLRLGTDPNASPPGSLTALWRAMGVTDIDYELMNALIDAGADPAVTYGNRTLLFAFVQKARFYHVMHKDDQKEYRVLLKRILAAYPAKSDEAVEAFAKAKTYDDSAALLKIFVARGVPDP